MPSGGVVELEGGDLEGVDLGVGDLRLVARIDARVKWRSRSFEAWRRKQRPSSLRPHNAVAASGTIWTLKASPPFLSPLFQSSESEADLVRFFSHRKPWSETTSSTPSTSRPSMIPPTELSSEFFPLRSERGERDASRCRDEEDLLLDSPFFSFFFLLVYRPQSADFFFDFFFSFLPLSVLLYSYVGAAEAASLNLTYSTESTFVMRADFTSVVAAGARGRKSVRLASKNTYTAVSWCISLGLVWEEVKRKLISFVLILWF